MARAPFCVPFIVALGCYTYVPPQPGRTLVGAPVQLALTDSGTMILAPLVGVTPGTVEGRLSADSAATYVVRVTKLIRRDGIELRRSGEQMLIPHALVASVETRRFSRARTITLGALTTAAAAAVAGVIAGRNGGSVSGTAPGGRPTPR